PNKNIKSAAQPVIVAIIPITSCSPTVPKIYPNNHGNPSAVPPAFVGNNSKANIHIKETCTYNSTPIADNDSNNT
ncbi:hypothetical protein IFN73_10445, partial [Francisella tularensis subsp. holarctica]|nr:hypothetical protein [Francisella tularensis subsp. holarctica]